MPAHEHSMTDSASDKVSAKSTPSPSCWDLGYVNQALWTQLQS